MNIPVFPPLYPPTYQQPYPSYPLPSQSYPTSTNLYLNYPVPLTQYGTIDYSRMPMRGYFDTIDSQIETRVMMVNYCSNKLKNEWFKDELANMLKYFVYSNGKVDIVKSPSERQVAHDSPDVRDRKIEYIRKNIVTKYELTKLLGKMVRRANIRWVDIPQSEALVIHVIKKHILKYIEAKNKK